MYASSTERLKETDIIMTLSALHYQSQTINIWAELIAHHREIALLHDLDCIYEYKQWAKQTFAALKEIQQHSPLLRMSGYRYVLRERVNQRTGRLASVKERTLLVCFAYDFVRFRHKDGQRIVRDFPVLMRFFSRFVA